MLSFLKRYTMKVIVGGCVAITAVDILGHPASISGDSMLPTLEGADSRWWKRDIVWLTSFGVTWGLNNGPKVGDIVTFVSPRDPKKVFIKRVTAVEGEMVRPKHNYEIFYQLIPKGMYWMESDNPVNANDSNIFGPVSHGLLQNRATHIIWPPHRWQKL